MLVKSLFLKILIYVLRALFFSLFLAFSYHLLTYDLRKNFADSAIKLAVLHFPINSNILTENQYKQVKNKSDALRRIKARERLYVA